MNPAPSVAVIGGGPAGLMAAEILSRHLPSGHVTVYERKPSLARKFLMAGRGGLNITHSEDMRQFAARYGEAESWMAPMLQNFTPQDMRDWCAGLGEETFTGTSGRVFPKSFKASPLLRAWQKRLEAQGVAFRLAHDWQGWDAAGRLLFNGSVTQDADMTLLALGGASWPRLGSDGGWVSILKAGGIDISPLLPANAGFTAEWSGFFRDKFAGTPVKPAVFRFGPHTVKSEAMITETGIEGGAIYALSRHLRDAVMKDGHTDLMIDLKPDVSLEELARKLSAPRRGLSLSNLLRKSAGLSPLATALLREGALIPAIEKLDGAALAATIKNLPVRLTGLAPIERAISTAGGIRLDELDSCLMLKKMPGVFVSGEMLDWEAPTGGYLLQGTFATAVHAAKGILDWAAKKH